MRLVPGKLAKLGDIGVVASGVAVMSWLRSQEFLDDDPHGSFELRGSH